MVKYDIIIPVSYKDCKFLRKNIPWIFRNIGSDFIYIITNKRCFPEFSNEYCKKYKIRLLDENELLPNLSFNAIRRALEKYGRANMTGWYFQQFLKLAFSLTEYARAFYLIWDADTVPLNKIKFFDEDSILVNPKKEHHLPYFYSIENMLGINDWVGYSFISEHMMVKTSVMKEMILAISSDEKWWDVIIAKCDHNNLQAFSEFETIGSYCNFYHPSLYKPRNLLTLRCGARLFGRQVSDDELEKLSIDFDTVSFERGQYPPFPKSIVSKLEKFFIEFKYRYLK